MLLIPMGKFGKHFQLSVCQDGLGVVPYGCDPPPQELALFGRTILEDVNETPLPRCPSLLQYHILWCPGEIDQVVDEMDLHHSEMFCLP